MFEIKVLNNQDFDTLGPEITKGSDISDSLGFADPLTGKAYVRYTEWPELQKYLINHELDELMASESVHEDEFGIRHKKGGGFWKIFLPIAAAFIPGIGPALSTGLGTALSLTGSGGRKGGGGGDQRAFGDSGSQTAYPTREPEAPQRVYAPQPQISMAQQPKSEISSGFQPSISQPLSHFQPTFQGPTASFGGQSGGIGSSITGTASPFASGLNRLSSSGFGLGSDIFNRFYQKGAPAYRF